MLSAAKPIQQLVPHSSNRDRELPSWAEAMSGKSTTTRTVSVGFMVNPPPPIVPREEHRLDAWEVSSI